MKKYLFLLLICIFIILLFKSRSKGTNRVFKDYKIITYVLKNKKISLLVADTREKWEKGLMYQKNLKGVDGMIFIFPDVQYRSFWNKNTVMDLDVYWILNDKIVGQDKLLSIEKTKQIVTISSPQVVNKVIELSSE